MIRLPSADLSLNLLHIVQLTSCLLVPDHHGGVDRAPGRAGGQPRHHGGPRQQGHRGQALPPGPGGDNHNDDVDDDGNGAGDLLPGDVRASGPDVRQPLRGLAPRLQPPDPGPSPARPRLVTQVCSITQNY